MENKKISNHDVAIFELKKNLEDSIIYQIINSSENKSKRRKIIDMKRHPTATLHALTDEEYILLKEIEAQLYSKLEKIKSNKSLKDRIYTFLEI